MKPFSLISQTFALGQINLGAFGEFSAELSAVSTHFGTVSPLSMFSTIFLQKKSLYPYPKYLLTTNNVVLKPQNYLIAPSCEM